MAADRREQLFALGARTRAALADWLGGAREVVHLGYARNANTGDQLILKAEQRLLESLGVRYHRVPVRTKSLPPRLRRLPLLLKGGGYLGEPWDHHLPKIARWLMQHRAPVLLQPCSACFDTLDPEPLQRACRWADVTIFAREHTSLNLLRGLVDAPVHLVPDSAFFAAGHLFHRRGDERAVFARGDREARGALAGKYPDAAAREWLLRRVTPDNVEAVIARKFDRLGWLATDRLHVHVAARLLGIPHAFAPNSYHKNTSFYATWGTDDPLVTWLG
jgi:exopolysaccharide biosynthesis predicted pyruvyltransferase EpsI